MTATVIFRLLKDFYCIENKMFLFSPFPGIDKKWFTLIDF